MRQPSPGLPFATLRDQRGIATMWTLCIAVAMLAVAALVLDGGYTMSAKRTAMHDAEQAARVGADALDQASLRSGVTAVSRDGAVTAAQTYLSRAGATGTVSVSGDAVTVVVSGRRDTTLLSAIGVDSLPYRAEATAVSINEDD